MFLIVMLSICGVLLDRIVSGGCGLSVCSLCNVGIVLG